MEEIVVRLSDLHRVCLPECSACHCQVELDMDAFSFSVAQRKQDPHGRETFALTNCPYCGAEYSASLSALNEFQAAYVYLRGLGIQFRVKNQPAR